ncbi:type I-E CRISPR-associated protein Cse2/CasB [Parathermosynechococcus lividus]
MTKTQTPPHNRLEQETKFLQNIQDRIKNDTGAKAAFKRALSGEHHHLRKVYPFTLPYLEGIHERQQDIWIFVACLSIYHDQDFEPAPRNFAQSCLDLHNSSQSKGPERRFRALLDTDLANIQSPMTALVRQIKSKKDKKIPIYYPQLIADLCFWDHPDQFIQDQWAKTFWRAAPPSIADEPES